MPWTGSTFHKHNHGLSAAGSAQAAKVANAILRDTGDEGKAIRIANWQAHRHADGGIVPDRDGGGGVGGVGTKDNNGLQAFQAPPEEPWLLEDASLDNEARGSSTSGVGPASSTGFAGGGITPFKPPNMNPPWFAKQAMRQLRTGPIISTVPGRTDAHRIKVPSGSYVIPAESISNLGDSNSLAGLRRAHQMFGTGPFGTALAKIPHARGNFPKAPNMPTHFAYGGYSEGGSRLGDHFHPVDVDVSGGEYIVPPHAIIARWGSLKRGHQVLDAWVMDMRKKHIAKLRRLPPPAKK